MKIRIKFAKYGTMKFIGHLDTMRFFQKALRRADIDIKYSEGFSPHQIMSFAAPLGVGIESYGENMNMSFPIDDLEEKLRDFYDQDKIPYTKETKKSTVELDLKQGIYELRSEAGGAIYMLVNASSSGNIKPTMVLEKFCEFADVEIPTEKCQVTRLETYTNIASSEEKQKLIPLAEAG